MAAESAALSKSLDRQLYLRSMVESLPHGQPELRDTDWRVHLRVPGILLTGAKSLYEHLQKDGSLPAERQTLLDVLVAKGLLEQECIDFRWLANSHQFADFLTKPEIDTPILQTFLRYGTLSLVPTQAQENDEAHRLELRRGQRLRGKERKDALKSAYQGSPVAAPQDADATVHTPSVFSCGSVPGGRHGRVSWYCGIAKGLRHDSRVLND